MNIKENKNYEYMNIRYEEIDKLNFLMNEKLEVLNNLITHGINKKKFVTIDKFIKVNLKDFEVPKDLSIEYMKPYKVEIRSANIFEKLFKKLKLKYFDYVEETIESYIKDYKIYEELESKRKNEILKLKKTYEAERVKIISLKKDLYINGDEEIIISHVTELLKNSSYPFKFNKSIKINYYKNTKEILIDYLLPKKNIVPKIKCYKYESYNDEIINLKRDNKEINNIYNEIIYSIIIRSIGEVFKSDIYENINSIIINGYKEALYLNDIESIKKYIISAKISKKEFKKIDLIKIDKLDCIKNNMRGRFNIGLNYELKNIEPIICSDNDLRKRTLKS